MISEKGMLLSEIISAEEQEHHIMTYTPFLAGTFEVGGSIRFKHESRYYMLSSGQRASSLRVYPSVEITDNRTARIQKYAKLFGGKTVKNPSGKNSLIWSVKNQKAARIIRTIAPYAPSRRVAADALSRFENAESNDEKIAIADEIREHNRQRFRDLTIDDYRPLVKNSLVLTGIYMARGTGIFPHEYSKKPIVRIDTENINMLLAIQEQHGGEIPGLHNASELDITSGILPTALVFDQQETEGFLDTIEKHLLSNAQRYHALLS